MNYIAYTIGPIYDTIFRTLQGDHKTKRLKAGSYFFSYFMRLFLKHLYKDIDILVPYVTPDILNQNHKMGLFHDRFIATSHKSAETIKQILNNALEMTYKELSDEIDGCDIYMLKESMDNHLLIASQDELKALDENLVFAINAILDSMELQRSFSQQKVKNAISLYQDKAIQSKHRVKTLAQIADEMNYYVVISADGDKMGDKIKQTSTKDINGIKDVSLALYEFFTKDEDIYTITHDKFGGELIYAGGDDILAFLPVKYKDKTFLDYIELLNNRFKHHLQDTSMSFGAYVVYHKYPLREAIENSFGLLKSLKDSSQKEHISLFVEKHSGQGISMQMPLASQRYQLYTQMLSSLIDERDMALPHSFHHSLSRYQSAIIHIYDTCNQSSLKALFETIFNDEKTSSVQNGIDSVCRYIDLVAPKTKEEFEKIFLELAIIKFLREDRKA
jgi:CRISPR-associated protein Cmr2